MGKISTRVGADESTLFWNPDSSDSKLCVISLLSRRERQAKATVSCAWVREGVTDLEGIGMKVGRLMLLMVVAGLFLVCSGSAMAAPTGIDFETLAAGEIVGDQYIALGAKFVGDAVVLSESAGTLYASFFPPNSGDKAIYDRDGMIRVDAVDSLWARAGAYVTGNTSTILTAYDVGWNVVGTSSTGGANYVGAPTGIAPNTLLSVSGPGIAHIVFEGSEYWSGYTVDDLSFDVAGAIHAPAPGAILLGSLGVGLVGWLRRRRMV
jgi:hypothetical protein